MKIAIIHDWLRVNAGSEKVVSEMLKTFQDEDISIYTLFDRLSLLDRRHILYQYKPRVSWLQYCPGIGRHYRWLLPLMPFCIRQLKPGKQDLYFSSSHAVAKGFSRRKGIPHICYCHTPMRYAWFQHQDYLRDTHGWKQWLFRWIIPWIRKWDLQSAEGVNFFVANSEHIRKRIKEIYQREARVIYPPVQIQRFALNPYPRQDFYLAPGRFVSHKKIDLVIQAFQRMPHLKLVLIGDGYEAPSIRRMIRNTPNIIWLGYQHDDELILYMQQAKACLFAAKEDFGIMCVEAQATGTPVLALRYGGYCETIQEGLSGYFFEEQSVDSIYKCVQHFEANPLQDHEQIRKHTLPFSAERFREQIRAFVQEVMNQYANPKP